MPQLFVEEVGKMAGVGSLDGHRDAFSRHADYNQMDALGRVESDAFFAVERFIAVVFADDDLLGPDFIDIEGHEFEFAFVFKLDIGKLEGCERRLMVEHDIAWYRAVYLGLRVGRLGVVSAGRRFDFERRDVVGFLTDDFSDYIKRLEVDGVVACAVDVTRLADDEYLFCQLEVQFQKIFF